MGKALTIAQLPRDIIIAEILNREKAELELTYEDTLRRGLILDEMPRKELEALYIETLLS